MPEALFRSRDLLVRRCAGHGAGCCVVTFDSFTDHRTLDRPGFGEAFLAGAGIDAIHVIPRDNHWYQDTAIPAAMARVREAAAGYERVVTYGSSMGGYAALRLAGLAGADAALALSPQFSIDPAVVPWERRWPGSSAGFASVWEGTLPFPAPAEAYVAYDPADADGRHAALLARQMRFTPLPLPGSGHPVTGFLAELGLLSALVRAVCGGTLDAPGFVREALARRERSPQYLVTQALALGRWQHAARLALMRQAVALVPEDAGVLSQLAVALRRARQLDEALAVHRRALALAPRHPPILLEYSHTLERMGDRAAALAAMEAADACAGGAAIYQPRLRRLRAKLARQGPRSGAQGVARWLDALRGGG